MNIVLIGYRGVGKSAVGKILSNCLAMNCVSTDEKIIEKSGMAVPDIVKKYGWSGFRDLESDIVRRLSGKDDLIIDTGGGIIERPENVTMLKTDSCIIWLKASVDTIVSRIQRDTQRPSLISGKSFTEEVEEVLTIRNPKYQSAAQFEIDTDNLSPEQVAKQILEILPIRSSK